MKKQIQQKMNLLLIKLTQHPQWKWLKGEDKLQALCCAYLDKYHPKELYIANPYSGMKMTKSQAIKAKFLGHKKSVPDLLIINRKYLHHFTGYECPTDGIKKAGLFYKQFSGLAIELKKDGEKLFKKKGTRDKYTEKWTYEDGSMYEEIKYFKPFKTEHLINQFKYMMRLKEQGFKISFGIGFEKFVNITESFLKG